MNRTVIAIAAALGLSVTAAQAGTATFDDLTLAPNSYENGAHLSGGFTSGGQFFNNAYEPSYDGWSGFSYSNVQDASTPGYGNQFAAATGGAFDGENYAVGYAYDGSTDASLTLGAGQRARGVYVTNTTYAALSMLNGDFFAKKFGGDSGTDADWFLLTATGYANGLQTGTTSIYLADYRFTSSSQDYIATDWRYFDLAALGTATSITFSLSSSDNGVFGMNTPAYFALDHLQTVPEPATLVALTLGGFAMVRRRGGKR